MEFYGDLIIKRVEAEYIAKICPFCKGIKTVLCEAHYSGAVTSWFYIKCCSCEAQGGVSTSSDGAIVNWNDREG